MTQWATGWSMRIAHGWRELPRAERVVLLVLVLSRLVLVAAMDGDRERMFNGDSWMYEGLALSLVEEGAYRYEPAEPFSDLVRPPGYPAFIAANYAVFGARRFVVPVLWNVVGVVLLFFGLRRLLRHAGAPGAAFAGALLAADLAWLLYSKELVTEPLFTPLLVWGTLWLWEAVEGGGWRRGAAAGLALGTAALVKPIALYLPLVLVPFVLWRRRPRAAAALAGAFVLCVAPWFARNAAVHDVWTFTSLQNHNLLYAHAAFVWADVHELTHTAAKDSLGAMLDARVAPGASFADVDDAKGALAREVLATHPGAYGKALVRGAAITLFDPGRLVFNRTFPTEDTRAIGLTDTVARDGVLGTLGHLAARAPGTVAVLLVYLAFLACVNALALLGIAPLGRARPALLALVVLIVAYGLLLGGPNGYARFRLYLFPFLLLLAHHGALRLRGALAQRMARRAAAAPSPPTFTV